MLHVLLSISWTGTHFQASFQTFFFFLFGSERVPCFVCHCYRQDLQWLFFFGISMERRRLTFLCLLCPLFFSPATNQSAGVERVMVLFTPTICKVRCVNSQCKNHCEKGNVTALYSGDTRRLGTGAGFRVFLCPLLCQNGGLCIQKDRCLCPPGFTGKFCQIRVAAGINEVDATSSHKNASSGQLSLFGSIYTLPLSNHPPEQGGGPSIVKVHVQHPPEASVKIHQVLRVNSQAEQAFLQSGHSNGATQDTLQPARAVLYRVQAQRSSQAGDYSESSGFGYCFKEINNGQCGSPLPGLRTLEICCRGSGVAWGVHECTPCLGNQGNAASRGQQENLCPKGFEQRNGTQCQDINECLEGRLCQNGECINTRGSYSCVCKAGYILDSSSSSCISQQVISQAKGPCYRLLREGSCSFPILRNITKHICCCSRVGKAWGKNCQRCPPFGSEGFKEICPAGPGYRFLPPYGFLWADREQPRIPTASQGTGGQWTRTTSPGPKPTTTPLTINLADVRVQRPGRPAVTSPIPDPVAVPESITRVITAPPVAEANVCALNPQICGPGRCVPRQSRYTCVCNSGFLLNAQGTQCVDLDECRLTPRPCANGRCENTRGSYHCVCLPGFRMDQQGTSCDDIDECRQNPRLCASGRCENTAGSYRCVCAAGFQLNPQGTECVDIDECHQNPRLCPSGQCENTAGSYRCVCAAGFRLNPQGTQCMDVDECRQNPRLCPSGRCENTAGSYRCVCAAGFRLSPQGTECVDVDECRQNPQLCPSGRCENTAGSYRCVCAAGFRLSPQGTECVDIDECRQNPRLCPSGRCENTAGSYRCVCAAGFRLSPQGTECVDVDECRQNPRLCPSGRCENTAGSYRCVCAAGFRLSPQGTECEDIDECRQNPQLCPSGRCENTAGSYRCVCAAGFRLSPQGTECVDVDECRQNPQLCPSGRCENTAGSYWCVCAAGFRLSPQGTECVDVDECRQNPRLCPSGRCENTAGSYRCVCAAGFRLSPQGTECVDVDECRQNPRLCPSGRCENTAGSYRCVCAAGFRLSPQGTECVDVDECRQNPQLCPSGRCENTAGSYRCVCTAGFQLNPQGTQCVDVDECRQNPRLCPNGQCENTAGSFRCVCAAGFRLSPQGTECVDINECENHLACPGQECVNFAGSFQCLPCRRGYGLQSGRCADINECLAEARCGSGGRCVNTDGSYRCECSPGYRINSEGTECADVNECLEGDYCFPNGECLNTVGSYNCLCAEGFMTSPEGSLCLDVDECSRGACQGGQCTNTEGSFQCSCQPGFRFHTENAACLDIDECAESQGSVCGARRCENTPGYFRCVTVCETGYIGTAAGVCADVDECLNSTVCGSHTVCRNLVGSYQCLCDQGYEAASGGRHCVDVNECETMQGACGMAICENVEGSFLCICPSNNEEFDPRTRECSRRATPARPVFPGPSGVSRSDLSSSRSDLKECYYSLNDVRVCENILARNVTREECCCTVGEGWGFNCQLQRCPAPGTAEYQSLCPHGKGYISTGQESFRSYKDVDECKLFKSELCKNGVCVNAMPGYSCYCQTGYYYDMLRLECIDNDECQDEDVCLGGRCINTIGSHYCTCDPPLVLDSSQRQCVSNSSQALDESLAFCWEEVGPDLVCGRPLLTRQTTYTECCCLYGEAWGINCALCPARDSDDFEALCNILRPPAYSLARPSEGDLYEYGTEFGTNYGIPYEPDPFLAPPARRPGPDYIRPGYGTYPSRSNGAPSYGSRSSAPYGQRDSYSSRGFQPPDFESDLVYIPPEADSSPPYGRQDALLDPIYDPRSRQPTPRYRPRNPQAGLFFNPEETRPRSRAQETPPFSAFPSRALDSRIETYEGRYDQFEGLHAEECGILNGCENGRCIRVPEGYTCDCYDGYHLDMTQMACVDLNECDEAEDPSTLCVNGQCLNTEGSYRCICLRGFVMSRQPNYCIPAQPRI
ncbi:latent-transforming growth factor beta-binding protein 4 [Latimeria chalumnae]|uniref:latent-transforming growth factor beta-binding protein 4 n=1 Tax=Latimeria chalumnae TaxID=7897 RepID=UPI00313C4C1B